MPPPTTLADLFAALARPTLRVRVGLWRAAAADLVELHDTAARLGVTPIDLRAPILARVTPRRRFLGLGVADLLQLIDDQMQQPHPHYGRLLYHVDLLLAYFALAQRQAIWQHLFTALPHRPYPVVLAVPAQATQLLPDDRSLLAWRLEGRLADSLAPEGVCHAHSG